MNVGRRFLRSSSAMLPALAAVATLTSFTIVAIAADEAWDPYAADLADVMRTEAPWAVVQDGDFGAPLMFLHEPGAGPLTDLRRDGLPLGTGHLWNDETWLYSLAGVRPRYATPGVVLATGAGVVDLVSTLADTAGSRLDTEFFKGGDESYLRRLSFCTPQSPWTLRFEFDERILHDFEGRDLDPTLFPAFPAPSGEIRIWPSQAGEGKARIARTSLTRRELDGSRLEVAYARARKHKQALPAFDLDRHEFWADRLHVQWRGPAAGGELMVGTALNGSDLVSLSRNAADLRTIESTRQSGFVYWSAPDRTWALGFTAAAARLHDDGQDLWWAGDEDHVGYNGLQEGAVNVSRSWTRDSFAVRLAAGGKIRGGLGAWSCLGAEVAGVNGGWRLSAAQDERAPRSDELWTPWTTAAPAVTVRLLPNPELSRERIQRAAAHWSASWGALDLALTATVRSLRDGIGWGLADEGDDIGLRGRWHNGLELTGRTLGLQWEYRREAWGNLRLQGRADLRDWSVDGGERDLKALFLPPRRSTALAAWWDHTWFGGDGILELGWQTEYRGPMSDPWLPEGYVELPAMMIHHALVMFRLSGADLGIALRNATDSEVRLSSGAMSRGRELRWRLQWTLWH